LASKKWSSYQPFFYLYQMSKINIDQTNPIGVFDSGIGGLTVAHAIASLMPMEQIVYFGDTAHLPYGDKSPEAIAAYSLKITDYLLSHNCKMIVIACNTASALGYTAVLNRLKDLDIDVVNVITPTVELLTKQVFKGKVGVICTKGTAKSQVYEHSLKAINPLLKTETLATPLLAPMIEEGYFNNKISKTIIHSYLSNHRLKGIKGLILGCTHYPLIMKEIASFYPKPITIVDSAQVVAQKVKEQLENKSLLQTEQGQEHKFFVSDYTESFEKSSEIFFRKKIRLEKVDLWQDY
jgi:glutamate racemase